MRRIRAGRGGVRCGGLRPASAGMSATVGVAPRRARGLGLLDATAGGALVGDMLAIARAIDVDPERMHGESVEDGGGEGGVAEVLAPVGARDVGRQSGRNARMAG